MRHFELLNFHADLHVENQDPGGLFSGPALPQKRL